MSMEEETTAAGRTAFIVWHPHQRRAAVLSAYLSADLLFARGLIRSRGLAWKLLFWLDYAWKAVETLSFLFRCRAETVFAQSPPSFCPMVCWLYCRLKGKKLVVDAHNGAFEPPWINVPLLLPLLRSAEAVIVHNREFAAHLRERHRGVKFFALTDRLPSVPTRREPALGEKYILVVVSYQYDEPVEEIMKALASYLRSSPEGLVFKITGRWQKRPDLHRVYGNTPGIDYLGFVSDREYFEYLGGAFGVLALSERTMLQQCASVEALAAGVPSILSDSVTARRLFFKGSIFTGTGAEEITEAIREFRRIRQRLVEELPETRDAWRERWDADFRAVMEQVAAGESGEGSA
jgi:glycosyltransferase involved in cell wall biosynthesis